MRTLAGLPLLANVLWLALIYTPEVRRAISGDFWAAGEVQAGLGMLIALTAGLSSVPAPSDGAFATAPSVMSVAGLAFAMVLLPISAARAGFISSLVKPVAVGLATAFTLQFEYWAYETWTSNHDWVLVLMGTSPAVLLIPAAVVAARSGDVTGARLAPWPLWLTVVFACAVSLPLGRLISAREFAMLAEELPGGGWELVRADMAVHVAIGVLAVLVFWAVWRFVAVGSHRRIAPAVVGLVALGALVGIVPGAVAHATAMRDELASGPQGSPGTPAHCLSFGWEGRSVQRVFRAEGAACDQIVSYYGSVVGGAHRLLGSLDVRRRWRVAGLGAKVRGVPTSIFSGEGRTVVVLGAYSKGRLHSVSGVDVSTARVMWEYTCPTKTELRLRFPNNAPRDTDVPVWNTTFRHDGTEPSVVAVCSGRDVQRLDPFSGKDSGET